MDELGRRLHDLAGRAGPTEPPADLGHRVRRRRRLRTGVRGAGGVLAAGLLVVTAFGVGQLTAPDVPPAVEVPPASASATEGTSAPDGTATPTSTACAAADLLTGPPAVVPGETAAQRFSVTLSPQAPAGCTLAGFRLVGPDEAERARADLVGVDLAPGDRVDLVVSWDPAGTCGTAPVQVRADEVPVGSLALPVCGDVSVQGGRVRG